MALAVSIAPEIKIMFSSANIRFFACSVILITIAYVCMALDPQPHGFGVLTLWIAPPILLLGFMLPVFGIIGFENFVRFSKSAWSFTWKRAFGVVVFLIAFTTYLLTVEPTASLWDCSEFIASAYKLQVPHTPGTPLSLLIGRIFSMLATDAHHVALMVNAMSAFFSALSVTLVYHIICYFGEKLATSHEQTTSPMLIAGSLCGSLCLAFSDTFWFSAVEAEIYGVACFFLLLIIWLMLKGLDADEPLRSRMFVLIGYMSGLSYCIHPMCLLVLPILPFAWYVRDRKVKLTTIAVTVAIGLLLVFAINRFVAIGIFDLAFRFDLIAVNTLGLPFYSGVIIMALLLVLIFKLALIKFSSYKMFTWAVIFLLVGFTPYAMLFIRSNHNPPIDETNPEDLYQIKAYMNRESYPSSPLLFGPYFDARVENVVTRNKAYYKDDAMYKVAGTRVDYQYEQSRETFLPRMYSRDPNHVEAYRQWAGLRANEKPGFADNLEFMFTYQLGHMYLRYLMWNFSGRESDVQDSGWLKPWDRLSNGNSERSRNQYWMVPLLLGIFGAWSQAQRDKKGFVINCVFFLFTGLILALYLNSPPVEPRERDYIYVASYISFAIWVGLGTIAVSRIVNNARLQFMMALSISIVPGWMLYQNYDDHDRSGRTFQIDYAKAVLNSCAPNAVLFTGGDNDTFPLWYLQEVEGFRTDVRVMVLSYFNTDWYINQLRRPYYDSPPLQFTLGEKDYRQYGPNDVLYLDDKIEQGIDVNQFLKLLKEEHPALRVPANDGDFYHILPSKTLKLSSSDSSKELSVEVTGNYLEKNALAILDLVISNDWKRPFYFNFTSMSTLGLDLKPYLVQEGLVFRLTPDRAGEGPAVNTALTYKNLVHMPDFTNLADASVNFNYEDFQARMVVPLRQSFNALAEAYMMEDDPAMAEKVLTASVEKLHYPHLLPSFTDLHTAEMLMRLGKHDLASPLMISAFNYYYEQVKLRMMQKRAPDRFELYILRQSTALLSDLGQVNYVRKFVELEL